MYIDTELPLGAQVTSHGLYSYRSVTLPLPVAINCEQFHRLGWNFNVLSSVYLGILVDLILCKFYTSSQSYCECLFTTEQSCSEKFCFSTHYFFILFLYNQHFFIYFTHRPVSSPSSSLAPPPNPESHLPILSSTHHLS